MTSAVCTLFEREYYRGVGGLINSLHRRGYRGRVEIGYRGEIPAAMGSWDDILKKEGIQMRMHRLKTTWHLANYKAHFLLEQFEANPEVDRLFYFDPDIVIKGPWSFFERWVEPGLALVEDAVSYRMSYNHPLRRQWVEFAAKVGVKVKPTFSQYFNGGFIGIRCALIPQLRDWARIMEHLPEAGVDLAKFMPFDRNHPFYATDQDALNILAMECEPYLSAMGPEAMDFVPSGDTMSHATGLPKPWRKNFLLSMIKGVRPSLAEKAYWDNVAAPLPVLPNFTIWRRKRCIRLASFVGRFYRK